MRVTTGRHGIVATFGLGFDFARDSPSLSLLHEKPFFAMEMGRHRLQGRGMIGTEFSSFYGTFGTRVMDTRDRTDPTCQQCPHALAE